uniref:Uncharacterized protein n=1 Tax=viral metagenome TaxID=1070528 RepID=A0A6M3LB44_9ZZZZ
MPEFLKDIDITPEKEQLYKDWFHGKRKISVVKGGSVLVGPRKDKKGERVEKFRLTQDQLAFAKTFRKINDIRDGLKQFSISYEGSGLPTEALKAMWQQLSGKYEELKKLAPPDEPQELDKMNFEDQSIRY